MKTSEIEKRSEEIIRRHVKAGRINFNCAKTLRLCYALIAEERRLDVRTRLLITYCVLSSVVFTADGRTVSALAILVLLVTALYTAIGTYYSSRETDRVFIEQVGLNRKQLLRILKWD